MEGHLSIMSEIEAGLSVMAESYILYEVKSSANRTPCTTKFGHKVRMEDPKFRLQEARKKAGYESPSDAARAWPKRINKNTLISHENGNRAISRKAAVNYADVFNVKAGWILYGDASDQERIDLDVPLLSMVSATNLREQPGISESDVTRRIKVGELPRGEWVALEVEGDSMNRIAPNGAVILVDRSDDLLLDGKLYIFSLAGGAATFKMYRRAGDGHPNRIVPFSTNPDHMAISADQDDLYVFGRVKRIIQDV